MFRVKFAFVFASNYSFSSARTQISNQQIRPKVNLLTVEKTICSGDLSDQVITRVNFSKSIPLIYKNFLALKARWSHGLFTYKSSGVTL